MRKLRVGLCLLLASVLLSLSVFTFAADYSAYNLYPVRDGAGFYVVGVDGNRFIVKDADKSKAFSYNFNNNISAWCLSCGKLYTLAFTGQTDIAVIHIVSNGNTDRTITLFGLKTRRTTLRIAADKKDNIYVINSDSRVEIFDKNGAAIRTTEGSYQSIRAYGGKVYASGSSGLSIVSESSDKLIMNAKIRGSFSFVNDSVICDADGNLFDIEKNKTLLSVGAESVGKIIETNRYFIAASGKDLIAYDKTTGKTAGRKSLDFSPVAMRCDGDTIYLYNGEFSAKSLSESKAFPEEKKTSEERTFEPENILNESESVLNESENNPKIDFGKYKCKGEYIFITRPTTRTQFKENIHCDGYKISFNTNRGVGTGTKMTLTSDDAEYTFTLVTKADITGEGNITERDLEIAMENIVELVKLEGAKFLAADMNDDGRVSVLDLYYLYHSILGDYLVEEII